MNGFLQISTITYCYHFYYTNEWKSVSNSVCVENKTTKIRLSSCVHITFCTVTFRYLWMLTSYVTGGCCHISVVSECYGSPLKNNLSLQFCEKKPTGFCSFYSIFLRNRSLSNCGWFYGKTRKIGKRNLYFTENRLSRNEMWCAADNHNYMCHICAKGLLDANFEIQIQIYLFFPSQTIGFKIIQRNINTEKLNNTIRDEDAIKTQGVRNYSTHRLHNYLPKKKKRHKK